MTVIVYTTPFCAPCSATKRYLTHIGVEYTAIDISDNDELRKDIFEKAHAVTVPIIQKGTKYVVGYKPAEIKELVL